MEIEVSGEELDEIRRNKILIEDRLRDVEGLERTLRALKLKLLIERRERLLKRLEEIEASYTELLEFEGKAKADRERMIELRRALSRENAELRKKLGEAR